MEDKEKWNESKGILFRTVMQMCAPAMKHKLESDTKFEALQDDNNVNGLLDLIQDLVYSTDDSQETYTVMVTTMFKLHATGQYDNESTNQYYRRLTLQVEVTESVWGGEFAPAKLIGKSEAKQKEA